MDNLVLPATKWYLSPNFNINGGLYSFLIKAFFNAEGKVFNLGSPEVISLEKLAQLICEIVPTAKYELVPFPQDRKKIDIGDYYADTTLIHKELGWEPSVSLTEGITKTLNFYRENESQYWDM